MSFLNRIIALLILGTVRTLTAYTLEVIDSSPKTVDGQSPFWCEETKSLYYCDPFNIDVCSILRYCSTDNSFYCATVDGFPYITFIRRVEGSSDRFVIGCDKTVEEIQWDGKSAKAKWIRTVFVAENCTEFQTNVFQDGKADPRGRLFCGTRRAEFCDNVDTVPTYANLFRVSADEPAVTLNRPQTLRLVNSMAWDENINKYYLINECDWDIKSYDYCPYTGDISNQQIVYNYTDSGRQLDNFLKGTTCDEEGYLWVGTWNSEIRKIDPRTGKVVQTISFPCKQISALCFSEKKWNVMYVTTAAWTGYGPQSSAAGKLFKLSDLGTQGSALHKVRLSKKKCQSI